MESRAVDEHGPDAPTVGAIRSELNEVMAAISLVSAGAATRVVVSNIAFGEELLQRARAVAAGRGVVIEPLWHADDRGCDIRIALETVDGPAH